MFRWIASLAVALLLTTVAVADNCRDCKCASCGSQSHCQKVCRLVCEMKEVKETHYCCKCEDFCVPGPSCKCGKVCEPDNFDCPCDNCAKHHCSWCDCLFSKQKHRNVWSPSCDAEMFTRTKLIKYQVPKKVPTYKWVVEYCCDKCNCEATQSDIPPNATTPVETKPEPSAVKTTSARKIFTPVASEALPPQVEERGASVRASDLPNAAFVPYVEIPTLPRRPSANTSETSWERLQK
jgi:hypothetical protein